MSLPSLGLTVRNPLIYHGLDSKLQQNTLSIMKASLEFVSCVFITTSLTVKFSGEKLDFHKTTPEQMLLAGVVTLVFSQLIPRSYKYLSPEQQHRLLNESIEEGKIDRLQRLLECTELTSLDLGVLAHKAMRLGDLRIFGILAREPRLSDPEQTFLLQKACHADLSFLQILLSADTSQDARAAALRHAIFLNKPLFVDHLIRLAHIDQGGLDRGLEAACRFGRVAIVDDLLSRDIVSDEGIAIAAVNISSDHAGRILESLSEHARSPHSRKSILLRAAKYGLIDLAERLLRRFFPEETLIEALTQAVAAGRYEMIELLLRTRYVTPEVKSSAASTAARCGDLRAYRLIASFCPLNKEQREEHLMLASRSLNYSMIQHILQSQDISQESKNAAKSIFRDPTRQFVIDLGGPAAPEMPVPALFGEFVDAVFSTRCLFEVMRINGAFLRFLEDKDRDSFVLARQAIIRPDGTRRYEHLEHVSSRLKTMIFLIQASHWTEEREINPLIKQKLEIQTKVLGLVLKSGF